MQPLRPLFAWALLGYAALEIFFTFVGWFEPPMRNLVERAYSADFATLITVGFPILAVLVAAHIQPVLTVAKTIAMVALIEYAAIIGFGVLAFLIGMPRAMGFGDYAFRPGYIVFGLAGLAFAALCGFATFRTFTSLGGKLPV